MSKKRSEYLARRNAEKLLGVSDGTLYHYAKQGLIRPHYFEDHPLRPFYRRSDLLILKRSLGQKTASLWEVESLALMALSSAQRAERRLETFSANLGLDIVHIGRDEESIRHLRREATKGFDHEELEDANWLRHWGNCFFSMDEIYLELTERLLGIDEPWKLYLDFASDITRELLTGKYEPRPTAAKFFQAGRSHLRHVSYMYCRRVNGRIVAGVVFDGRASAVDELSALLNS